MVGTARSAPLPDPTISSTRETDQRQPPRLLGRRQRIGSDNMAFKNFKLETDADGIAVVTWDIPGRSMNVLDETSTTELEEILKQTTADTAVKGVVITSAKEAFCAGADLSMLEGMNVAYAKMLKEKGEEAAN